MNFTHNSTGAPFFWAGSSRATAIDPELHAARTAEEFRVAR
jgi:hypothetical protein